MLTLELAMGLLLSLGLFQRDQLGFGQHQALLGALGFESFEPLLHGFQVVAHPHATHAGGQRTAIDVPPARRGLLLSGGVVLRRGVCRRERLFHVFQRQCQLLGIEPFGAAAEAVPLQLLDDCGQPLELLGMMRPLGQEQSTQGIGIGG